MATQSHKSVMDVNVLYQPFTVETSLSIIFVVYYKVVINRSQSFKMHCA